jgi:hypothetical protein
VDESEEREKGVIETIAEEYQQGKLENVKKDLEFFIKHHKKKIKLFCKKYNLDLNAGLRVYISYIKTIHSPGEMTDQTEEIKREVWYRREEGSKKTTNEIFLDWIMKHSDGWRSHRLLQIIYVFTQEKEKYLAFLT